MSPFNNPHASKALLVLCPISLALMGYAVKSGHQFPVAVILFARFGISAVIYAAFLIGSGFQFSKIRPEKHIFRTVLGFLSVACLFASISRIPLSTALCLSYTVPIFSYVISVITKQIKPDFRLVFVLGAVLSVALIVQPSADINFVGVCLAITSAFFGALALFEIKRISKTENTRDILFMYFLYSSAVLLLFIVFFEDLTLTDIVHDKSWPILLAVGLFGLLYQFSLVGALKSISVASVSLAMLVAVALGYGIDLTVLKAQISTGAVLGTLLLACCIGGYSRFQ